ncbi:hypothetical protein M404DRAFT_33863 [Pisolithus tinctorius Marx 270]|uniref:Uncharacterized protein n=1 Tax=Pisolithus tinctorius Marx 270 TaxID=870435 RepID=A0A0C3IFL1_PISTI|nr:hypothetical protein M404DRAFT_33863 [Pisolithus tinctorius Marx 270]
MSVNEFWEADQPARSLVNDPLPFANSTFVSNGMAVAGLLGGEEATSTAALTQIYDRRRWFGKVHIDPTLLFEHEGWSKCPRFNGIYSGAFMHPMGPLASQLMKKAAKEDCQRIGDETTEPVNVTSS